MFNVACSHCGNLSQQDESRIPVSGIVMKCPACGKAMIVMPPKTSDLSPFGNKPAGATDMGMGPSRTPASMPPKPTPTTPPRPSTAAPLPRPKLGSGPAMSNFDNDYDDDEVDLPAPKGAGAESSEEIIDLPAPKLSSAARAASQADLSSPDLLAPVGPAPTRRPGEIPDLMAPVGPTSRNADLPAPVGPRPREADLLAPVGPTSRNADLLTPVGPTSRNADLMTPVGPTSRNADLMTPVGPTSRSSDLMTPVGPTSRSSDLMTPVGPTSRNIDLPRPLGPTPRSLDLPTPVGPESRNLGLPTPVGPQPTKNLDIAPKGFFDDIPQPKTGARLTPVIPPPLDMDDLDVVPATAPPPPPQPEPFSGPATFSRAPTLTGPPAQPFSMEGLELLPPDTSPPPPDSASNAGMNYGQVEVPEPPPDDLAPQVVSFGKPAAPPPAVEVGLGGAAPQSSPDELDMAGPRRREKGTLASDPQPVARVGEGFGEAVRPEPVPEGRKRVSVGSGRRARIITSVVLVLAVLGGAAFFVYTRLELQVFGLKTRPYKAREEEVRNGLFDTRKFMSSDERGHWDKAVAAARKVVSRDRKNAEALGLLAQAHLAAAIDEGHETKAHRDAAEEALTDGIKVGAKGIEIDKAQALRDALEGKAVDGKRILTGLAQRNRTDPDLFLYQGWVCSEARDYTAAKAAFEIALQLTPNRLPAQYGLGRALLALGDPAGARAQFDKIMAKYSERKHFGAWLGITELIPPDRAHTREKELGVLVERAPERETAHSRDLARAWTLYGDEALAQNLFDRAADRYRKAAEIDPRNLDAMVGFAFTALEQGKKDDARGRLQSVQALDPNHVRALVGLTRLALLDERPDDAVGFIGTAQKLAPNDALVQLWLGHVVVRDPKFGGVEAAETAYRKATQLAPNDYQAYVALARLLSGIKGRESDAVAVLAPIEKTALEDSVLANTLGETYLTAREAGKAEDWFRAALRANEKNVQARSNLGAALELAGKNAEALAEYEAAYAMDAKAEEISLRLAAAYVKAKRWDDAQRLYQAMVSNPDRAPSVTARAAAGRYWARRGDASAAAEQGAKILEADPRMPAGLFLRGFGLLHEEKYNEAQRDINEAIQLDPQAQYWDALGRVFEKQNALSEALAAFEKSSRIDEAYVAPRMGRVRIRMIRAEYLAALKELGDITKIEPENADAWARIGDCHWQERDLSASAKAFTQALKLDPTRADVYFMRGRTTEDDPGGSRSAAISDLRKAIELGKKLNPQPEWFAEAHGILGFLYQKTGSHSSMCSALREYLQLAPPEEGMREEAKRAVLSCR